jgi:chromosome partitioning protein
VARTGPIYVEVADPSPDPVPPAPPEPDLPRPTEARDDGTGLRDGSAAASVTSVDAHETEEHVLTPPLPSEEAPTAPEGPQRGLNTGSVATGDLATPDLEPTQGQAAPTSGERPVRPLPRVIAVANQKGGVGKTTTTVNLGASLALFGFRVLIVDLDPQGNATTGLGVDGRGFQHSMYDVLLNDTPMVDCIEPVGIENLFVAPATLDLAGVEQELFSVISRELRLKRALTTVVDDYDFILVDCPPSLGLITINAFAAASEILVPVQCEYYALEGLTQLQRIVTLVQKNLNEDLEISTVVLTMYDGRTRLSEDVANEVRRHFPSQTQGTVIPRTVRLSEAPSFGQPITTFDPASKGARAYKALAREVSDGAQKRAG